MDTLTMFKIAILLPIGTLAAYQIWDAIRDARRRSDRDANITLGFKILLFGGGFIALLLFALTL